MEFFQQVEKSGIDATMAFIAVINFLFGYLGFFYENRWGVYFYWLTFIPHPMYFGYHFWVISTLGPHKYWTRTQQVTVVFFLIYAVTAFISHLIALPLSVVCYSNFGKGLKQLSFIHSNKKDRPYNDDKFSDVQMRSVN